MKKKVFLTLLLLIVSGLFILGYKHLTAEKCYKVCEKAEETTASINELKPIPVNKVDKKAATEKNPTPLRKAAKKAATKHEKVYPLKEECQAHCNKKGQRVDVHYSETAGECECCTNLQDS